MPTPSTLRIPWIHRGWTPAPSVYEGICGSPSRLSHVAFPGGIPTGLSHVPPWCESILGVKVEAVQGNRFL